jgi:hypothetical protein
VLLLRLPAAERVALNVVIAYSGGSTKSQS